MIDPRSRKRGPCLRPSQGAHTPTGNSRLLACAKHLDDTQVYDRSRTRGLRIKSISQFGTGGDERGEPGTAGRIGYPRFPRRHGWFFC